MRLLFIGDSLIEYFDWQERFPNKLVFNCGVSGETVEGLYARTEVVFNQVEEPDAIFIMSGINNLAMGDKNFIPTYRKLVKRLKEHYPLARIFVQSLLPVLFPWISNDEIKAINIELKKAADAEKVAYLDIHSLFLEEGNKPVKEYFQEDGIHVNGEGYSAWSREIEKLLET